MLSGLTIKNFKSIGETGVDLELRPLTILVGPNGSGKSSIFEALALAAQSIQRARPLIPISDWNNFRHKRDNTREISIQFLTGERARTGYRFVVSTGNSTDFKLIGREVDTAQKLLETLSRNTALLTSTRGKVPESSGTGGEHEWVGSEGQSLIPILAKIFGSRQYDTIGRDIAHWANTFGLAAFRAGFVGDNRLQADFEDPALDTFLNLALSSTGARQILTVITQLCWSKEDSITIIEEPEISLHPDSLLVLIELFAAVVKQGKQILITTHSPILLMALSHAVQQTKITSEDVAIYHVEKKKEMGTVAKRLPVSQKGYIEGWIPSFAKVERKLLREWVRNLPEA